MQFLDIHNHACLVLDTCVLLDEVSRQKLEELHAFIPRAVIEELYRIVKSNHEAPFSEEIRIEAQKAIHTCQKMIKKRQWDMSGSNGSGIVQSLQNKRMSELGDEVIHNVQRLLPWWKVENINQKREQLLKKEPINPEQIDMILLEDFLGATDLRILATAIKLSEDGYHVFLVTYDRILAAISEGLGIKTINL